MQKITDLIESIDEANLDEKSLPEYLNKKGIALCYLNKFEDALCCFEKSINLISSNPDVWNNKGILMYK